MTTFYPVRIIQSPGSEPCCMFKQDNDSKDVAIITVNSSGLRDFLKNKHETRLHVLKFQNPHEFVECLAVVASFTRVAKQEHRNHDDDGAQACSTIEPLTVCVLMANVFEAKELLKTLVAESGQRTGDWAVAVGHNTVRVAVWELEGSDCTGDVLLVAPSLADHLHPIIAAEAALVPQRKVITFQELKFTLQMNE